MSDTTRRPNEDAVLLVHAYLDGELDPANALAIERRIAGDPALAAERARIEALRQTLREKFPREVAAVQSARAHRRRARVAASTFGAILAHAGGVGCGRDGAGERLDLARDAARAR